MVNLSRSILDLADARAVVVGELPATNIHLCHVRRHLQDVRLVLDDHVLRESVSLALIGKHAAIVDLRDLHAASRKELARHLVIKQFVALESCRKRLQVVFHGLAQMRLHRCRISDELLLRFRQAILPCRTPLVFDVVEDIRRRICRRMVLRKRHRRQTGRRKNCGQKGALSRKIAPNHHLHENSSHFSVVGIA